MFCNAIHCRALPDICALGVRGEDHHLCEEWAEEIQEDAESRLPRELWGKRGRWEWSQRRGSEDGTALP